MERTYSARMTPQQVNYRKASDPQRCCRVCYMNDGGNCTLIGPVEPGDVCDRFIPSPVEGAQLSGILDNRQAFPVVMGALDHVLALAKGINPGGVEPVSVHGYERFEHGKLEHVAPHTEGYAKSAPHVKTQGMMVDALGHEHWGWYGGAGLLLHHTDEHGITRYMLQKRSFGVQHGSTYSTPGGAIDKPGGVLETPEAAAFREAEEEWGKLPVPATVTGASTEHHGTPGEEGHWSYTTVSASVPKMFKPTGHATHGSENAGHKWVTPEEMSKLDLHPDFVSTAVKLGMPEPPPKQPKFKVGQHLYHYREHTGAVVTKIREPELYHAPVYEVKYDYGKPETGLAEERHLSPYSKSKASAATVGKKPDDYAKGAEVTWMYQGKVQHGTVQGGVMEGVKKGYLPNEYTVKADDGQMVEVRWTELAPKGWYDKPQEKPSYGLGTPVYPGGTMAPKPKFDPEAVPKLNVMSPTTPGMQYQVPTYIKAKSGDYQTERVWEHPSGDLVLGVRGPADAPVPTRHAVIYSPSKKSPGSLHKVPDEAEVKKLGLVEAKLPDSGAQGPAHTGALGKVVAAKASDAQKAAARNAPFWGTYGDVKGAKFQMKDRVIHDLGYPNKKAGVVTFVNGSDPKNIKYNVHYDDGTHSDIVQEQKLSPE